MDLATLIGLLGAFAFIVMAMLLGGDLVMFYDTSSILIVLGGSTFVVLMKYNIGQFFGAAKIAIKAFMFKTDNPEELIAKIVEMADAARKGGFLALEEMEITNPFMRKGIDMLVDGHDADVVRGTLQKDISLTNERHEQGVGIFSSFGDVAPAMGMIGTLIGLVAMLSNMDDPKAIGPAMAVALLTTLYGSMLANMVAIPIADKLTLRKEQERLNKRLILDGVLAIQDGQNPRVIDGYLKNYLHEKKRSVILDE
ncbi:flagellar motor protein PomA [Photobacterium angustum]|uniref:Flagellar motor protein PomA n=2 Tax=Photobacterium angustum TaxID=661 RepID=A0A0D8S6A4_PHOAN|nr:flagellar motor protein PomA [Photobacterium angustum]KJF82942.1 flagellar motor protein PomA [Photobacterium damselae subsp. damselae]EAS63906.1 flagellar motor protein [Photobacterium angustum S14]KJF96582.1 flagellar motor protein PomA [Photobacterium angustum]KJG03803.1 flagellar motor protein PomA [Photobacterium angustum]KJG07364.1 flagellar motor protein PomA [Photobacterium angustum]